MKALLTAILLISMLACSVPDSRITPDPDELKANEHINEDIQAISDYTQYTEDTDNFVIKELDWVNRSQSLVSDCKNQSEPEWTNRRCESRKKNILSEKKTLDAAAVILKKRKADLDKKYEHLQEKNK